jgi:hypothetical protein
MKANYDKTVTVILQNRIRKISTDGIITLVAGTGESDYNGDGRPALESQIGEPCGVAVDRSGYIYLAIN